MSQTFRHRLASSHFITFHTFSLLDENLRGSQSILKTSSTPLRGSCLRRPGSNESLWRQRRNFHRNCLRFSTSHSQSSRLPEGSFIYPGNRRRRVKPAVEAICRRVTTDIRHLIRPRGIRWHVRFQWPRVLPPLFVGKRWRAGRSHTRDSRMELPVPLRHPTQLKGICASLISPAGFTRRGNSNG